MWFLPNLKGCTALTLLTGYGILRVAVCEIREKLRFVRETLHALRLRVNLRQSRVPWVGIKEQERSPRRELCRAPGSRPCCTIVHACHILPMTRLRLSGNIVIKAARFAAKLNRTTNVTVIGPASCLTNDCARSPRARWTRLATAFGTGSRADQQVADNL